MTATYSFINTRVLSVKMKLRLRRTDKIFDLPISMQEISKNEFCVGRFAPHLLKDAPRHVFSAYGLGQRSSQMAKLILRIEDLDIRAHNPIHLPPMILQWLGLTLGQRSVLLASVRSSIRIEAAHEKRTTTLCLVVTVGDRP